MVPTPFLVQWQQKGKANRRLHPPNNRPFNVLLVLNPLLWEQVWEDQAAYNRQEGSVADSIPTGRALSISSASTSAIDSVIRANPSPFLPVTLYQHRHTTTSQVQILLIPSMLYMKKSFHEGRTCFQYHPGNRAKKSYNQYQNGWLFTTTPPFKGLL